jgi:hypothetical protein
VNFSALRYFGHRALRRFGKAANHGHYWDSIKPRRVLPRLVSSRQKSPASKGDQIKRPVKLGHDCARPRIVGADHDTEGRHCGTQGNRRDAYRR